LVYDIYFLVLDSTSTEGDVDAQRRVVAEHFALCYVTSRADWYSTMTIPLRLELRNDAVIQYSLSVERVDDRKEGTGREAVAA
jgi:hypothetical protein